MGERAFAAVDRSKLVGVSRHFLDSLVGLALGLGVLALAAGLTATASATPAVTLAPAAVSSPLVGPVATVPTAAAAQAAPATPAQAAASATVAPAALTSAAPASVASAPPSPAAAKPALSVEAYRYGGRRYAGVRVDPGTTFVAPRAGTVQVRVYQLVDGDVRVGSNVPWLAFFPYVTLTTSDGTLVYRPGALKDDAALLVEDGDTVAEGAPLFRVIGDGASSWRTFYDSSVSYSVVVSLVAGGVDLDPAPLIVAR